MLTVLMYTYYTSVPCWACIQPQQPASSQAYGLAVNSCHDSGVLEYSLAAHPDAKTETTGSWMAPKSTDTCRRTITISKQHAPSSKAGGAADLPGNKLGTFCYKNHVQNVFHTLVFRRPSRQREVLEWHLIGWVHQVMQPTLASSNTQHAGMVQGLTQKQQARPFSSLQAPNLTGHFVDQPDQCAIVVPLPSA